MKILLIGADGQLGTDFRKILAGEPEEVIPSTIADMDITDIRAVQKRLQAVKPDVVISTAAENRVDYVEDHPKQAFAVNALGPRNLAVACRKIGAILVSYSTDYVFDGQKPTPYIETDPPNPLSVYGASKTAGEQLIRLTWEKHFILRTCGLFGTAGSLGKDGNFVETMLKLAHAGKTVRVVADQTMTPTYTIDLAQKTMELIRQKATFGTYHMTQTGECSWFEFATKIFEFSQIDVDVHPITTADFNAPARRPAYSVLDNAQLRSNGITDFRHWESALKDYLEERKTRLKEGGEKTHGTHHV